MTQGMQSSRRKKMRLQEVKEELIPVVKQGDPVDRMFQVFIPAILSIETLVRMANEYSAVIDEDGKETTEEFQRGLRATFDALIYNIRQSTEHAYLINNVTYPRNY